MSIVTVCGSAGVKRWILRNQGQQFYLFEPLLYFEGDRNFGLPLPGRPRLGRAQDVGPLPRKEGYSLARLPVLDLGSCLFPGQKAPVPVGSWRYSTGEYGNS